MLANQVAFVWPMEGAHVLLSRFLVWFWSLMTEFPAAVFSRVARYPWLIATFVCIVDAYFAVADCGLLWCVRGCPRRMLRQERFGLGSSGMGRSMPALGSPGVNPRSHCCCPWG